MNAVLLDWEKFNTEYKGRPIRISICWEGIINMNCSLQVNIVCGSVTF